MAFKALLDHALPYRRELALVVILSLLGSLAGLAVPWLAARMLGGILNLGPRDISLVALLLVLALAMLTLLSITSAVLSSVVSNRIEADFRRDIYEHVQRLPLGFFDMNRKGDLLALLTWEVERLSGFVSGTITAVPAALLTTLGALAILFAIDPMVAMLVPVLVPAYYVTLKIIGRRLRGLAQQVQEAEASVLASAEENLEMLPAIKAFAREELRLSAYEQTIDEARSLKVREQKIYAVLEPVLALVTALAAILVLLAADRSMTTQRMDPAELFTFLLYAALLTRPVGSLANLYGQFNTARGTLERLHHVLQHDPEPGYAMARELDACQGSIAFNKVCFSYRGREATLRGIDLDIGAGEIVALTGDNGAGKTTIVKLLLGFYPPASGSITLDGIDIATLNIQQLRSRIGYVPQRPLLANGSVRENITLGTQGIAQDAIERAAELAQALDFIRHLPEGFDTQIGDHGVRLSGGQRQRIALARALLDDPSVLILDEATSMYDLKGETAFVEACKAALAGRTVIIITHRPASLALADRIISISGGKIAPVGALGADQQTRSRS